MATNTNPITILDSNLYQMTLPNGLSVIYSRNFFHTKNFIKFIFNYGFQDALDGTAHLLEHLVASNCDSKNTSELFKIRDNACTTSFSTIYYSYPEEDKLYDYIKDYINSFSRSDSFKKRINDEKQIIAIEHGERLDNYSINSYFVNQIYPFAIDDLKVFNNVLKIKDNDVLEAFNKYYIPNNCTLFLTSSDDPLTVYDKLSNLTASWITKNKIEKTALSLPINLPESFATQIDSKVNHLYYSKKIDLTEENFLNLIVLKCFFKNYDNYIDSIFTETRLNKPLTYSPTLNIDENRGIITFIASTLPQKTTNLFTALKEFKNNYLTVIEQNKINEALTSLEKEYLYYDNNIMTKMEYYYDYNITPIAWIDNNQSKIYEMKNNPEIFIEFVDKIFHDNDWKLYINGRIDAEQAKELDCRIQENNVIKALDYTFLT
jgi:predicted Zn-dependent peptidase